jgi:nucleoside-diphosphate-sugar epimerase
MPRHLAGIIVTGSSGLIGRPVCEALVRDGYRVAALDRPGTHDPPRGVANIPCDVTSDESVTKALRRVHQTIGPDIASVIHLATHQDFTDAPSPLYDQLTIQGTRRLLAGLTGLRVEQFVFGSTMFVHAPSAPGEHISEDSPLAPAWIFPEVTLEAERLITAQRNEMPVVLLRMAGAYTDRCESTPLAAEIQAIYERRPDALVLPADVTIGQSFVHLADLVDAFRRTVTRRSGLPDVTVILLGEEEPVPHDERRRSLARLIHGADWETTSPPKAGRPAGLPFADDHYALDITRARTLLGWTPVHHLRATLPRMVTFLKTDPEGFYRIHQLAGSPPKDEASASAGGTGSDRTSRWHHENG